MKIALIGMNPYYESDRILYEALSAGHEAVFLSKKNIIETTFFNEGDFGIYFKKPTINEQVKFTELLKGVSPLTVNAPKELSPFIHKKGLLGTKKVQLTEYVDIRYFDAFLIREVAKTVEWSTILASYLLAHNKTVIDQKIGTEMYYKSKHGTFYKASSDGFPYPKTIAVTSRTLLLDIIEHLSYPIIVKRSESSKGLGVYKCNSKNEVIDLLREESLKPRDLLIQECVDYMGDIRVFVVGEKVLGAMRREPQQGQWKGNVAQGAKAYPVEISESIRKLALDVVRLQNSELIGVDIMLPKTGPVIIETNRVPQFKGFESSTGINVAKEIVTYLEQKHAKISKN